MATLRYIFNASNVSKAFLLDHRESKHNYEFMKMLIIFTKVSFFFSQTDRGVGYLFKGGSGWHRLSRYTVIWILIQSHYLFYVWKKCIGFHCDENLNDLAGRCDFKF